MSAANDNDEHDPHLRPLHPIRTALVEAMQHMDRLRPTVQFGEPREDDIEAFVELLMQWVAISDRVTLAFGEFARSELAPLSAKDVEHHFRDQLLRAIDGCATHIVRQVYQDFGRDV